MTSHLGKASRRHHGNAEQAPLPDVTLSQTISQAQEAVRAGLGARPGRPRDQFYDDHDTEAAYDAEVATVSGHLGVVEAVIHPAARRRLPRARATVAEQRARARRIERLMRLIEGRFHGDSHADGSDVLSLQRDLLEHVDAYSASERALVQRLDDVLSAEHRRALVARFDAAMADPPTRPHPFAPHPRGFARLVMRACTLWDHVMDEMDNRPVDTSARRTPSATAVPMGPLLPRHPAVRRRAPWPARRGSPHRPRRPPRTRPRGVAATRPRSGEPGSRSARSPRSCGRSTRRSR